MLVRVGYAKPGLVPTLDRWGNEDGGVEANLWGWMPLSQWVRVEKFQNGITEDIMDIVRRKSGNDKVALVKNLADEVERLMLLSGSRPRTAWEMDILTPNKQDYMRVTARFGSPVLREWSWFEATVLCPLYEAQARLMNMRRFR